MNQTRPQLRAARPLPPGLPQLAAPILDGVVGLLSRRHPGVLDRLAGVSGTICIVMPEIAPVAMLLTLQPPAKPGLRLVHADTRTSARAIIRADFPTLLQLLEGRIDGDALFFSRDLVVEGDMEAVVALRNALDGAGIDLIAELASVFGPFAGSAERMARQAIRLGESLRRLPSSAERP